MTPSHLVRSVVRSSLALTCAGYMVDNWLFGRRLAAGRFETRSGTAHAGMPPQDSLRYVEKVYRDYCGYAGVDAFCGTVAEIGPGDNFGVALLLLANGATGVHAIDRYYARRDPKQQRAIYRALNDRYALDHLFAGEPSEEAIRNLTYHVGQAAETFFGNSGIVFDAILSRAVMEHLYDPLAALDGMLAALRPGGLLVHRIDLRDHGMFPGRHPLTFLTLSDAIYGAMTRNSGRPNRVLLPDYRDWLARSGVEARLHVCRLVGTEKDFAPVPWAQLDADLRSRTEARVKEIRPRLANRFSAMAASDLAVAGCVLVARKPEPSGA